MLQQFKIKRIISFLQSWFPYLVFSHNLKFGMLFIKIFPKPFLQLDILMCLFENLTPTCKGEGCHLANERRYGKAPSVT